MKLSICVCFGISVLLTLAAPLADEVVRENALTAGRSIIAGKGLARFDLDRDDALYRCGEEAAFTVTVYETNGVKATHGKILWRLDNYGAHRFAEGRPDLSQENPFIIRGTLSSPGFLRLTVLGERGRQIGAYSAAFEPEKIRVAVPKPDDFDSFWDDAVARLAKEVPLDPKIEPIPGYAKNGIVLQRVSFATFGGKRVYGALGSPADLSKGPFPVDVHCPGAGLGFCLKRCFTACATNRISLFMSIHSFPIQETGEATQPLYDAQESAWRSIHGANRARAYPVGGLTISRERGHYFDKILGINRAFDWVANLPQADARHVAYSGASQGGGLGLILAGLNKSITHGYMGVPALCDLLSCKADGRQSGWPRITEYESQPDAARLERIQNNARYFDAAYFAERIRIPVRLSVGYVDESCAPHTVLAAYNAIPSADKRLYHGIGGLHGSQNAPKQEIADWLKNN